MSELKSPLNGLKQFRIERVSKETRPDEQNLGMIPGRKRLQALQDSDSENDLSPAQVEKKPKLDLTVEENEKRENESPAQLEKKPMLDLSVEEKEKRFVSAIKIVPQYDPMDLQDSLLRCNWDVSRAIRYLKEHCNKKNASRVSTISNISNSSNTSNEVIKSSKQFDQADDDDLEIVLEQPSQLVYDSDEDSDVDASNEMTSQRKDVFNFINTASQSDLRSIRSCSEKKILAIMEFRPYTDWNDLKTKFENNRVLSADILNNCQDLITKRNNVADILTRCNRMVKRLEIAIAAGGGITEQPDILNENFRLAEYQMIGLNWLAIMHKEQMNGILADEMGLGKTIQVIAFLSYLKERNLAKGCHLIVVPASTLDNWYSEIAKWCPTLVIEKYYGNQEERRYMRTKYAKQGFRGIDVLLTTYNTVASTPEEKKMFRVSKLHCVIFDEAHRLKNMNTQSYSQLITINAEMRILLTGTPLQNNLLELMSLLCFVMPSFFARNTEDIKSLFQQKKNSDDKSTFEKNQIDQAKRIMKPFVLRRLKKDVLQCLPTKTEHIIKVPMSSEQNEYYKELVEYYSNSKGVVKGTSESAGVTIMMDMRKLSNHPLLMRYYYSDDDLQEFANRLTKCSSYKSENQQHIFEDLAYLSDFQTWQMSKKHNIFMKLPNELILNSGKFRELDKMLPKFKEEGRRTLIFSQFTMMLDILEKYLDIRNYGYLRLDGSSVVSERQKLIDQFNEDEDIFIFLLSTKAGGMGINLTAAETVIIHDIDFNPYNDKQAEDRCHRIGQTKPVNIYRLVSEGSIEEGMLLVAQEKLKLEKEITAENDDVQEHKCMVRLLTMALGMTDQRASSLLSKGSSSNDF